MIQQDQFVSIFNYLDGDIIRKTDNKHMGCKSNSGSKTYIKIWTNGRLYFAHQLVFLWHHGYIPEIIDHIDGDSLNNRIENLRAVTMSQNLQNTKRRRTNTSGYKGVSWSKQRNCWIAQITVNRKCKNLGGYKTKEEAYEAYQKAAFTLHTTNPEAKEMK